MSMLDYMMIKFNHTKWPYFESRSLLHIGVFDIEEWKELCDNSVIKVEKGMHCKIYILNIDNAIKYKLNE